MALTLYRRHRRECKAGHPEQSFSTEFDERKRGWKRCECPIVVSGTLKKQFRRHSTALWEWEAARSIAREFEAAGSWDRTIPESPQPTIAELLPDLTKITDATEAFLDRCRNRSISSETLRKYKTFTKQFSDYCEYRGYVYTDQLTVADMDRFYASWKDGPRSKGKKLDKLRSFVKFCLKRKWLSENIADDLEAPHGASESANRTPFTDEELNRLIAACDAFGPPIPKGPGYRPWGGEDAKDFIFLSVYTGLRISDVCLFDTDKRFKGNDVFLRMHKTKKELYTWVPDWLVERLLQRKKVKGSRLFLLGHSTNVRTVTEQWRRRMRKIFELAGPFDEHPHPHRFRSTFARILLEKGVPEEDVATLIGDTVAVLRKHYSKWLPTRQARLTRILQQAFEDKPQAKVVTIR